MADEQRRTPEQEVRKLYEEAETRTARAVEELVGRESFGELLARMTENAVAITRLSSDAFDLVLRNLRLAGRQDVTRLAKQIARTEDKLEMVLQEVERLGELLREREEGAGRNGTPPAAPSATPRRTRRAAAKDGGEAS